VTDLGDRTRTAPRRPSLRDAARKGALLVVGTSSNLESLRRGRLVVFDEGVDLGRRPPPVLGRTSVALADRTVSGLHARISFRDNAHIIEDAGSTNGTMVDGRIVAGSPVPLREGAVLFLGSHVLVFRTVTALEIAAIEADLALSFAPVPTLSPALAMVCAKLRKLAPSSTELLLLGETGVGKEVFAGAIHACSGRKGPLVVINCAALPRELVESELFGYERGAHSTAKGAKEGLIETAHGGTLFLDELGEMPLEAQGKLLRFIQDRTYLPIGATRTRTADVRILAASSRAATGAAAIQAALMGRLGAEPINLPALRDRLEDIGHLVTHFLANARSERGLSEDAFQALFLHSWPLNVRELSKVIAEADLLSRDADIIGCEHLPSTLLDALDRDADDVRAETQTSQKQVGPVSRPPTRERRPLPGPDELRALLERYRGNVAHVAKHLDRQWAVISRSLRRHEIDPAPYRARGDTDEAGTDETGADETGTSETGTDDAGKNLADGLPRKRSDEDPS
jgi:DNA-binding NtrC family response regulator